MRAIACLSIRQPWADLIIHHGKDIENRSWPTRFRGRIFVHASKGMTMSEYADAREFAHYEATVSLPEKPLGSMMRGGIIGTVEIVDCVDRSDSPWYCGEWGFVLRDPEPLGFMACRGRLGIFPVPDEIQI